MFCCYKNTTSIYRSVGAINVARGEAALSSAARRSPWQLSYSSQFTYLIWVGGKRNKQVKKQLEPKHITLPPPWKPPFPPPPPKKKKSQARSLHWLVRKCYSINVFLPSNNHIRVRSQKKGPFPCFATTVKPLD